jgi:hypothetical protein
VHREAQFSEPTVQVLFMQLLTLVPRYLSKTKEEHIANLRENCCDVRRCRRNRSRQRSNLAIERSSTIVLILASRQTLAAGLGWASLAAGP